MKRLWWGQGWFDSGWRKGEGTALKFMVCRLWFVFIGAVMYGDTLLAWDTLPTHEILPTHDTLPTHGTLPTHDTRLTHYRLPTCIHLATKNKRAHPVYAPPRRRLKLRVWRGEICMPGGEWQSLSPGADATTQLAGRLSASRTLVTPHHHHHQYADSFD